MLYDVVIYNVDDHFAGGLGIVQCVFGGVVAHPSRGRKNKDGRVAAKHVEITEWAQVGTAVTVNGTGKSNGPRTHEYCIV